MGWHYKPPQTFPATYFEAIRAAVKEPGERVLLASFLDEGDSQVIAERFRHFKWCVRHIPSAHAEMYLLLESYSFRTKVENDMGFHLWLTATPNMIAEFSRLNPELAANILSECQ